MLRRSFRIGVTLGLLAGLAFALSKLRGRRASSQPEPRAVGAPSTWPPLQPEPTPTTDATTALVPDPEAPTAAVAPKATAAWVDPSGDMCPTTHPVKAKLSSKIFHLPGMVNYGRTKPDRCYRDAPSAEADGLRPAKR